MLLALSELSGSCAEAVADGAAAAAGATAGAPVAVLKRGAAAAGFPLSLARSRRPALPDLLSALPAVPEAMPEAMATLCFCCCSRFVGGG